VAGSGKNGKIILSVMVCTTAFYHYSGVGSRYVQTLYKIICIKIMIEQI